MAQVCAELRININKININYKFIIVRCDCLRHTQHKLLLLGNAKLSYIYVYVYKPYQGELTFVTALIFVPINPLAISLDYIATLLYRIYFYICTKQMILIVCLF